MTVHDHHRCCAPSAERRPAEPAVTVVAPRPGAAAPDRMVALDGGEFLMGSQDRLAYPDDGEGPVRAVRLDPFGIDPARCRMPSSPASSRTPGM